MQSEQDSLDKETDVRDAVPRRHQRHQSLGKAMPVTSLLLNFPPLHRSAYYTRDERLPDHELPPIYFSVNDNFQPTTTPTAASSALMKNQQDSTPIVTEATKIVKQLEANSNKTQRLEDSDVGSNEQDFEILVSECSGSSKSDESDEDDIDITIVGNSTFYTPCLTCTDSAPVELASRPSAINEMCRRLCSDECRLRLSLAGFEPPSEIALKSQIALAEHVGSSLCGSIKSVEPSTSQSVGSTFKEPPALPSTRPPPPIAIQRKKFLMELLTPTDSDNDSNFVDDSDKIDEKKLRNTELLEVVSAVMDQSSDINEGRAANVVDPHEITLLKDFRERLEIAEALAKTSAMTSTAQIKQRLAARKLEIELESLSNEIFADEAKSGNASSIASTAGDVATAHDVQPVPTSEAGCGTLPMTATNARTAFCGDAKISLTRSGILVKADGNDFEPPRDLLLYLVRMGSFNSAPKINNVDSQDDDLELPQGLNTSELLNHVKRLRGEQYPPLLSRFFFKTKTPITSSLATQLASSDISDGLRYLQLNTVSQVCSAPICASPNHIRLLQWNILSQSLGQNNDGFVRCPEEALTWENRKFLIIQEILQHNPDIVCLQEVDHFKFLQTILGSQNYDGIFFPKPDSPCLYIEENNGPDGCAIFFKRDKFELKQFETRILEVWRVQSNQVAIAANLYVKAIDREICVCTTHLKARQGSLLSKLRNEQGRDLIRFVRNFAGENRAVLLCGDFNAEPVEPVYATMLSSAKLKLSSAYADIRRQDVENDSQAIKAETSVDETVSDDSNAYEENLQKSVECEPPYTTWKIREDGEECHTIDYVFYEKDKLKVLNCLEFPLGDEIGKNRTPSFQYPSDHFSLVCDFEILESSERKEHDSKLKAQ